MLLARGNVFEEDTVPQVPAFPEQRIHRQSVQQPVLHPVLPVRVFLDPISEIVTVAADPEAETILDFPAQAMEGPLRQRPVSVIEAGARPGTVQFFQAQARRAPEGIHQPEVFFQFRRHGEGVDPSLRSG